jgi:hypothetical protein
MLVTSQQAEGLKFMLSSHKVMYESVRSGDFYTHRWRDVAGFFFKQRSDMINLAFQENKSEFNIGAKAMKEWKGDF